MIKIVNGSIYQLLTIQSETIHKSIVTFPIVHSWYLADAVNVFFRLFII